MTFSELLRVASSAEDKVLLIATDQRSSNLGQT